MEGLLVSESLDDRQTKSHSFSWSCSVSGNHISSFVYEVKCEILNWEELLNAFFLEHLEHFFIFNEICEFTFLVVAILLHFYGFWINISYFLFAWVFNLITGLSLKHCWICIWIIINICYISIDIYYMQNYIK